VGIPAGFDMRQTNSLGLQLVYRFTEQLGGAIAYLYPHPCKRRQSQDLDPHPAAQFPSPSTGADKDRSMPLPPLVWEGWDGGTRCGPHPHPHPPRGEGSGSQVPCMTYLRLSAQRGRASVGVRSDASFLNLYPPLQGGRNDIGNDNPTLTPTLPP
jgi:hypothetical protein